VTWLPPDGREFQAVRGFFKVSNPCHLGVGRDVVAKEHYSDLRPVCAWRVTSEIGQAKYDIEKQAIATTMMTVEKTMRLPYLETRLDAATADLAKLDRNRNEKWLLHGTRPENIVAILQNGLNEHLSGGLFGSGIYLAEDVEKIDQYATPDFGSSEDKAIGMLHQLLYTNEGQRHPGRIFYGLVVQVALGMSQFTKDGKTNVATKESCFARADKRELATVPGVMPPVHYTSLIGMTGLASQGYKLERHQEFVSVRSDRTCPVYLVAYQRA
jgi:hypothetical protein